MSAAGQWAGRCASFSVHLARTAFILVGATLKAFAIAGIAMFGMVVSGGSMKKATAISQGSKRLGAGALKFFGVPVLVESLQGR